MPARNPQRMSSMDSTLPSESRDLVSVMVQRAENKLEMCRTANSQSAHLMRTIARFALTIRVHCPLHWWLSEFSECKKLAFCHFGPTTQPNPPKIKKSRPNPWVDPTHGQLCDS